MTHILEVVPNDAELDAMAQPRNQHKQKLLQKKRDAKKRLDSMLEDIELKRALADNDFEYY